MKNVFLSSLVTFMVIFIIGPVATYADNGQIMFIAKLNTDNEVPTVRGDALGMVTFLLSEDRKEVLIHGLFTNLTGPVIGCHIHQAASGVNGPVLIDLTPFVSGNRIKTTIPLPAGLLQLAQGGQLYINVHTNSHLNGEIRGQLVMEAETIVPVYLGGDNVVPPDTNKAGGLGTLRFSQNLTRMQYEIMPINLSGPVTSAHLHHGKAGANGPIIADLNTGDFITGTFVDTALLRTFFQDINSGNLDYYIDIHTSAKPNGEIRSNQFHPAYTYPDLIGTAILNGDQEVPPVNTTAKGYAYLEIDSTLENLAYYLFYSGITPTNAHIHQAAAGVDGPIVVPLDAFLKDTYTGSAILGDDVLTSFLKDELYFNIHSANNPNGEIRGQIENNIMNSFAFDLCGDQENPKKTLNGYGVAYVAINRANTELDYGIITDAINGDVITTRLYDGAFGSNGSTLLNLDLPNPYVSKVVPITGTIAAKINADRGYINNHTAANPSGEIRGQVRRVLSCKINSGNQETNSQNFSFIQDYSNQTIFLETDIDKDIDAKVILTDLTGKRLLQWNTLFIAGTNIRSYSVSSLSSGFYLMNIMQGNKIIEVFKFIKI